MLNRSVPPTHYNLLFVTGDTEPGRIFILLHRLHYTPQTQLEPFVLLWRERNAGHAL
jgi:hypothetical protein